MRSFLRKLTIALISIISVYCIWYYFTQEGFPTYLDCGKVIKKSQEEVSIRRGVRTELYLIVEFEKSGLKAQYVNPTTYFKFNKGDTVCFNIQEEVSDSHKAKMFFGFILFMVFCFVLVIFFVAYLVGEENIIINFFKQEKDETVNRYCHNSFTKLNENEEN